MTSMLSQTIKAKKSLGQNFLINEHVVDRIVASCGFHSDDTVLEIGPGQGVLTSRLTPVVKQIIAVEKDRSLVKILSEKFSENNVHIIHEDFLDFDIGGINKKIKIIGNLPYNISTPILLKIIDNRQYITQALITVQLEFGQRLVARPHTKDYGSLSCMTQYYACAEILFKIHNTSFFPRPKVQSCFMRLDLSRDTQLKAKNEDLLFHIIRTAFFQRRKKIRNSLASLFPTTKDLEDMSSRVKINTDLRAENLTINEFISIADYLSEKEGAKRETS